VDSGRRRYENDAGKVGADAIRVAGRQGPPRELSVCADEEVWKRHQGRDSPGLLAAPLAVPAIGGGTSDQAPAGMSMICTPHDRTRPAANSGRFIVTSCLNLFLEDLTVLP
jgi:hypothetical protein